MAVVAGAPVGRYLVIDRLGAGGMGVVYAAYDPVLDRKVALKIVRPVAGDDALSETRRARLVREAQAMAQVVHPNVIAVHDVGTHEGDVFISMDLVEGLTLSAWLARAPRAWREIVRVFAGAGRGLAAAHRAGVVHRDFKPDNVLVREDGEALVGDFGLARAGEGLPQSPTLPPAGSLTETGAVLGTPAYMAPEQHQGEPTDARTDQFSFCVALYEALYGQRPFAADAGDDLSTADALALTVSLGQVRPPPRGARVPLRLSRIVLRGLRRAPGERYPSMDALLADLERVPGALPRRLAVGVLLGAAAGALVAGGLRANAAPCGGAADRLAGVWDAPRRAQVRRAFLATGRPYAAATFERSAVILDRYAAGWTAMRADACRATEVRHEQSPELLDRRMACLDRRLSAAGSLVALFAAADDTTVERAVAAVGALPALDGCADADALRAAFPPPADAAARARVAAGRRRVDQARALSLAGRLKDAYALATVLAVEAGAQGYAPLTAEALGALAPLAVDLGDARAAAIAEAAARAAGDARDDALLADALTTVLWHRGAMGDVAGALALSPVVDAVVRRGGNGDAARADYLWRLGFLLSRAGRYAEAETRLAESVALRERASGPRSLALVKPLHELADVQSALRKTAEAQALLERTLAIIVENQGAQHPLAASVLNTMGTVAWLEKRYGDALRRYREAAAIAEAVYGPSNRRTAAAWNNVAMTMHHSGDLAGARREYERARDARVAALGPDHPEVAESLLNLGQLARDEGHPERAEPDLRRALAILEKSAGPDHPLLLLALRDLAEVELALQAPDEAAPLLERAWAVVESRHLPPDAAQRLATQIDRARCRLAQGQPAAARALLAPLRAGPPLGDPLLAADLDFAWARLDRDPAEALRLATAARATYEHQGERRSLAEVDAWLRSRR